MAAVPGQRSAGDGDRDERRERQAGDRHDPLRHARVLEAGQVPPQRLVAGRVRAEGEQDRDERAEPEHRGHSPAAPEQEHDEARDREHQHRPAEVDHLLEQLAVARDEARQPRREVLDLVEGTAACAGRVPDDERVRKEPRSQRGHCQERGPRQADERVEDEERDHAQREVQLSRERHRDESRAREHEPPERSLAAPARPHTAPAAAASPPTPADGPRSTAPAGRARARRRARRPATLRAGARARGARAR